MTNTRIVVIGLIGLAILFGLFLEHLLLGVFGLWSVTQPLTRPMIGDAYSWTTILGLSIATAIALYVWKVPKYNEASHDVVSELKKVTWPSAAETRAATVAVVLFSLIAALVLGMFDVLWQFLTDTIQNPSL